MSSLHVERRMGPKSNQHAFTLVELLVVISIIAVLLTVLVPALQAAKQQAQAALCLAHQRSLAIAYVMYNDDNDGQLVGSYCTMPGTASPYESPWVCPPMQADGTYFGRGSATAPILAAAQPRARAAIRLRWKTACGAFVRASTFPTSTGIRTSIIAPATNGCTKGLISATVRSTRCISLTESRAA